MSNPTEEPAKDFSSELRSELPARVWAVVVAVNSGGRTRQISRRLAPRQSTDTTRRWLKEAEAHGLVQRHPQYSYINDIYWVPTGIAPVSGLAK